jgi:RNA polymerase sigma-70 factor (ECF subfamily)
MKGGILLKQDLYEKLVAYIIENQNKFYRLAFSYVKNQEDALDIVQNSVCKALEHYKDLRNEGAIVTWFYKIVLHECYALLKAKKRIVMTENRSYWEISYEEKGYEIHDELYDQINQMEEDVQKIIKLRFFEELTLSEIAQILKMNLNTVKTKLYRGLKTLKVAVEEEEGV